MVPPVRQPITRNRERLACTECRRRKLRCDRKSPCNSCIRRDDSQLCTYERLPNGLEHERERRVEAEARLRHLEQLVHQLASQPGNSDPSPAATSDLQLPHSGEDISGRTASSLAADGEHDNVVFHGPTHWSAMLKDIEELRFAITPDVHSAVVDDGTSDEGPESGEGTGIGLLFGTATSPYLSLHDILAKLLPPRQDVDRLISAYFRAKTVAAPFIHGPQFRRQYNAFWKDPCNTSPLWISILFSICHTATNTLRLAKRNRVVDNTFSVAAARCLVIGKFFTPGRFAVESLLLYAQSQCLANLEVPADVGLLFSIVIHMATTAGLHRDPDHTRFSPFEVEMRRRTWSMCMSLDMMISFHLGLPSNVQFPLWDTKTPSNLIDVDFDEDTAEMPRARPASDINETLFYIAKHRFMTVFGKVLRHVLTPGINTLQDCEAETHYAEVERLDAEIRGLYASLPEVIVPKKMTDSVVDPASLIVTRLCVSFLYWKCLCVLHRPYVTRNREKSIITCYEAATHLVRDFVDAYQEFLPGGQTESEQWFLSCMTWHDFLLGTTALCLLLCVNSSGPGGIGIEESQTLLSLEAARAVCNDEKERRKGDTRKAVALIDAILAHFRHQGSTNMSGVTFQQAQEDRIQDDLSVGIETEQWIQGTEGSMYDPGWEYLERFLDVGNFPQGP